MSTTTELLQQKDEIEHKLMESGGVLDAELEAAADLNAIELRAKWDARFLLDKVLESKEKQLKELADSFYEEAAKIKKAKQAHLEYLKQLMISRGVKELKGDRFRFQVSSTAEALVIEKESQIPEQFWFEVVDKQIDKEALKAALLSHQEIPGAKLEGGFKLNKYVNK